MTVRDNCIFLRDKIIIYLSTEYIKQYKIIVCDYDINYYEFIFRVKQKIKSCLNMYFKDGENMMILNINTFENFKNMRDKKKVFFFAEKRIVYSTVKFLNYECDEKKLVFCKLDSKHKNVVLYSENKKLNVFNINSEKKLLCEKFKSNIISCDYFCDLILSCDETGNVEQYDIQSKKFISKIKIGEHETICFCKYNEFSDQYLLSTMNGNIFMYDLLRNLKTHRVQNESISFHAKFIDSNTYISGFMNGAMSVVDTRVKKNALYINAGNSKINSIDYFTESKNIISCSANGCVKLWDMRNYNHYIDTLNEKIPEFTSNCKFVDNNCLALCNSFAIEFYCRQQQKTLDQIHGRFKDFHLFDDKILLATFDGKIKLLSYK